MSVCVEFFGVPRLRTGVERTVLEFETDSISLAEVLSKLTTQFREFANEFIVDGTLHASLSANKNGDIFIDDPQTQFEHGDTLLVLSADAGG